MPTPITEYTEKDLITELENQVVMLKQIVKNLHQKVECIDTLIKPALSLVSALREELRER